MIPYMSTGAPTVIISKQQAALLQEGIKVTIDGASGHIRTDLGIEELPQSQSRTTKSPITRDGVTVNLRGSVRDMQAAERSRLAGAQSIGLVRSEFLVPNDNRVPDYTYYLQAFADICEAAAPLSVTIRLLDIAADKIPPWMPALEGAGSALGLQGVRLYAHEPMKSVCEAQIAAIDELSGKYDINVLIPYLVRHEELSYWVNFVRQRLSRQLALGAMVETPAGALDLANWFDLVDFIAIGCNDLMQCLFAADRDCGELRDYLDPYAPLLWLLMRQIAETAEDRLDNIQLCGVLAQLPGILPILLGLGYRTFSVESMLIPYLQGIIATTRVTEAEQLARQICDAHESREVRRLLGLPEVDYQPFLTP
jgi:phosphoenolpyruvate-protein kinase (PTS system EI component)